VIQAVLPLILKAKGMIVSNTSVSSVKPTLFSSVYHASKAAAAMFSDYQRIELGPFGVKVVDLKIGYVHTNFHSNRSDGSKLPEGSVYEPMREEADKAIAAAHFSQREDLDVWSKAVVDDLLKLEPPARAWRGTEALTAWFRSTFGSTTYFDLCYEESCLLISLRGLFLLIQQCTCISAFCDR